MGVLKVGTRRQVGLTLAILVVFSCGCSQSPASKNAKTGVDQLIAQLKSENRRERMNAAEQLRLMRSDAKEAIPALVETLKEDSDPEVRRYSAEALGHIGPDATPNLVEALKDEDPRVRALTCLALGNFLHEEKQQVADQVLPSLYKAIKDDEVEVRQWAAYALNRFGPIGDGKTTLKVKIEALEKDRDKYVRGYILEGIANHGKDAEAALPILRKMAESERDTELKNAADVALRRLESIGVKSKDEKGGGEQPMPGTR